MSICVTSTESTFEKIGLSEKRSLLLVSGLMNKVEMILEENQVAFLSRCENSESLNCSTVIIEKFKFSEFLPGYKNATYLSSKTISTLLCF